MLSRQSQSRASFHERAEYSRHQPDWNSNSLLQLRRFQLCWNCSENPHSEQQTADFSDRRRRNPLSPWWQLFWRWCSVHRCRRWSHHFLGFCRLRFGADASYHSCWLQWNPDSRCGGKHFWWRWGELYNVCLWILRWSWLFKLHLGGLGGWQGCAFCGVGSDCDRSQLEGGARRRRWSNMQNGYHTVHSWKCKHWHTGVWCATGGEVRDSDRFQLIHEGLRNHRVRYCWARSAFSDQHHWQPIWMHWRRFQLFWTCWSGWFGIGS